MNAKTRRAIAAGARAGEARDMVHDAVTGAAVSVAPVGLSIASSATDA
jgi:hypothetical protein